MIVTLLFVLCWVRMNVRSPMYVCDILTLTLTSEMVTAFGTFKVEVTLIVPLGKGAGTLVLV